MDPGLAHDLRHYRAEAIVTGMGLDTPLVDAQEFLWEMQESRLVRARWPEAAEMGIEVRHSTEDRWVQSFTEGYIRLPSWARSDFTMIHEFAHFCEPPMRWKRRRGADRVDHGPRFVQCELALVRRFMSVRAHNCLKHSLRAVEAL